MNNMASTQSISVQFETLSHLRARAAKDAADLCSELLIRFRLRLHTEISGFLWEYVEQYARVAATSLGDVFSETLDSHFESSVKTLRQDLVSFIGDDAPDITRTELDMERRALLQSIDHLPFQRSLLAARPNLVTLMLSPSLDSEKWDDWESRQRQRAIQALSSTTETMRSELTGLFDRYINAALDEYQHGLNTLNLIPMSA